MSTVITVIIQYSDLEMKYLKRGDNGVQNAPQAMEITIKHVKLMTCTIGGALEHQKVQNHQKLKCSKNALFIHQIVALGQLFQMSTMLVSFFPLVVHWSTKKYKIIKN